MELTVTAKGQFTLNKGLMEHLGIKPGEKVSVTRTPEGLAVSAAKKKIHVSDALDYFRNLRNANGGGTVSLTIEEMNDAIGKACAEAGMQGLK